jgi:alanine dehydrogenase
VLKYTYNDYKMIDPKKICWGWHHLVQNKRNVDLILEKQLTIISIEQMFEDGKYILEDNRLIAGYASVMHSLQLKGQTGYLLDNLDQPQIAIISYGCVGKGATDALCMMGMHNVDVYTKRNPELVTEKRNGVNYYTYPEQQNWPKILKNYDIIINCILQDPLNPIIFLKKEDITDLTKNMFIIDISCDPGMGFDFAVSTTFKEPIIKITDNVDFYGIDHSPSIFYDTITRKISKKILKYIGYVIDGEYMTNNTLSDAIEIDHGVVVNKNIILFQNR